MSQTVYNNIVLEDQYESVLASALDYQQFMKVDDTLEGEAGNTKRVVKHTVSGSTEDLAMGSGNSGDIEVNTTYVDYPVLTTQGRFKYYDEEAAADPAAIEGGLKGLAEKMTNDFIAKAIAEFEKAELEQVYTAATVYDKLIDAVALAGRENVEGWFILCAPKSEAALRKGVGASLQYVEAFARNGYIGQLLGMPVYVSKAVPENAIYIASPEAVRCFIKKGSAIETERIANTRQNIVYARKVACVALVDDSKLVKMGLEQTTAATVTTGTKNTKTIAGAATTGATVEIYLNGALVGTATAASSAYTFTAADNLAAGDKIKVVAHLPGYVNSKSTEFTVAS